MLILHQASSNQLSTLIENYECSEIDGLVLPKSEEIAPLFLLEFIVDRLNQDAENSFWWTPRLIVVDKLIVGMCGFKSPPDISGSVEIGYGVVDSQQRRDFATKAVDLLVKEGFLKAEIQTVFAYTTLSNTASWRVLEKNRFVKGEKKIDPEDGEVWIWRKVR